MVAGVVLAATLSTALGCAAPEGNEAVARAILAQQTSDGAITMAKVGSADLDVITYFGCFAADGLVDLYRVSRDGTLLVAARKWVDWYAAHQNPDGTIYDYKGRSGAWRSTGHFDSTDSYAAVYLSLLDRIQRTVPNEQWLRRRYASVQRAVAGIELTLQPCGLTLAKPGSVVMYTMDNTETLLGLRSAVRLAASCGDAKLAKRAGAEADKMESAIDSLEWDSVRSCYRTAVQSDGGKMEGLSAWYPDIMANLMAIGWLPASDRNRALFARMRREFASTIPEEIQNENDLEKLVWWGWAAKGAGDESLLDRIRTKLPAFEAIDVNGCDAGLLGHVARLTAR